MTKPTCLAVGARSLKPFQNPNILGYWYCWYCWYWECPQMLQMAGSRAVVRADSVSFGTESGELWILKNENTFTSIICTWNPKQPFLNGYLSIAWWTKSLHRNWFFNQRSILNWLFGVPGRNIWKIVEHHTWHFISLGWNTLGDPHCKELRASQPTLEVAFLT